MVLRVGVACGSQLLHKHISCLLGLVFPTGLLFAQAGKKEVNQDQFLIHYLH